MSEHAAGLTAPGASVSDRLPEWTTRLAKALAGNEGRTCQSALEMMRHLGRLPTAEFAAAGVLVAILEEASGAGVLLTRRRDGLAAHPGQVAFPGGAVEPMDEDAEHAALREAEEEVALTRARVRVLGRLPRYPTTSGYLVSPVVGYVAAPPSLRAQPEEVADIFVVPLAVVLDPAQWQRRPLGIGNERIKLPELHWQGQRIWGATAGMLQLLIPPLREAWTIGS